MEKRDIYASDPRINKAVVGTVTEGQDTVKKGSERERLDLFRESGGSLRKGCDLNEHH